MATRNDDRVSSARLLDMLKGLQENRHLGSEPEVTTETIEYPAKVRPVAGTYPDTEQGLIDMCDSVLDIEHNLPIKVYGAITRDTNGFTVPEKSGEPLATLGVVSNVANYTIISDIEITDEMLQNQPITGHYFMFNVFGIGCACFYEESNITAADTLHVWETTASTEVITTKTKHPIKQDYVPNADWTQNDPDGEGYVQGRTHWVEEEMTGLIPKAGTYNSIDELQAELNSVEPSMVYVCDAYPNTLIIQEDWDGGTFPVTLDDYDGEPVAVLDKEFEIQGLRVLAPSDWDGDISNIPEYLFIFKTEPYYKANTVMSVTTNKYYRWKAVAENVHKIPNKYIDFPEVEIPENWKMDYDKPNGAQYTMNTGVGNGGGFPFLAHVYCKVGEQQTPSNTTKRLLYFFNTDSNGNWSNNTVSKYLNDMQIRLNELLSNGNKTDVRVVIAYLATKTLLSVYRNEYDYLEMAEEYLPDEVNILSNGSFRIHYTGGEDPSHTATLYSDTSSDSVGTGIFITSSDIDFTEMAIAFSGYLNPMFFNQAPVESSVEYGIKIPDIQYDISFYDVKVCNNITMKYDMYIGSHGFLLDRSDTDDKIYSGTIYLPGHILEKLFNTIGARGMKGIYRSIDPAFTDTLEYHFASGALTVERVYDVAPSASQVRGSCNIEYFTWTASYYN